MAKGVEASPSDSPTLSLPHSTELLSIEPKGGKYPVPDEAESTVSILFLPDIETFLSSPGVAEPPEALLPFWDECPSIGVDGTEYLALGPAV